MPARRRGQESKRAQHRAMRGLPGVRTDRVVIDEMAEFEQGWEEHQAYERHRRSLAADPIYQAELEQQRQARRESIARDLQRALRVVNADFARWRRGDFS